MIRKVSASALVSAVLTALISDWHRTYHTLGAAGTGPAARQQQGLAKVIPISRANNVSIMLTQFSSFRAGPHGIRRALVTGTALSLERLSLLLQARNLPQHVL